MRRTNARRSGTRGEGFTLIELMLVVTLIAIIIAIAIPNLTAARKAANEVAAISALRTLCTAETHYRMRFGTYASLSDLVAAATIDDGFADTLRGGYIFNNTVAPTASRWSLNADPQTPGVTGDRHFFIDHSGVIRFNESAAAGGADQAID